MGREGTCARRGAGRGGGETKAWRGRAARPLEREPNRRLRLRAGGAGGGRPGPRCLRAVSAAARLRSYGRRAAGEEGSSVSARPERLVNVGLCPLGTYAPKVTMQGSSKVVFSQKGSDFCFQAVRVFLVSDHPLWPRNWKCGNPFGCSPPNPLEK